MRKSKTVYLVLLVLALLSWLAVDYVTLPAYSLQSFGFWFLLALYAGLAVFLGGKFLGLGKAPAIAIVMAALIAVIALCASATSWLVWPGNAARYYAQLPAETRTAAAFAADFPDAAQPTALSESLILPRTDKQLSTAIAQGKLGNYGARFRMDFDIFTAIALQRKGQTKIVRVSPLDYTGFMVALTSGAKGTAGYIEVDQESEEGRLVEVAGGMRYTPGAVFGYDLDRLVRFHYRTLLLGDKSFEIDDEGNPFWVVPVVHNAVGLFGGPVANGVIIVNPTSGKTEYFHPGDEPAWVDRAVPTSMILAQANNHLRLKNGWINAAFGEKRDVFQLSDSYNYVFSKGSFASRGGAAASGAAAAAGGDSGVRTWLVSGITSPSESDQSLAGFMMVNMRTKEARRYEMTGITEMRAMEIARSDERVRAQNLEATWPIAVELGGESAYYLFLKNAVQRQRFVYIDLATGQKVAMGDTMETAKSQFVRMLGSASLSTPAAAADLRAISGQVLRVKDSSEDGSVIFLLSGDTSIVYSAPAGLSNGVRFLAPGDRVEISYREIPASPGRRFVLSLENKSMGR